jgi:soluble lytic murein transglycosylase-like protein
MTGRVGAVLLCLVLGAPAYAGAAGPLEIGIAHYRQGRLAAAEAAFRKAVRASPRSTAPRQWLGITLYGQRRYREAAQVLEGAQVLAPGNARTWLWWGHALARSGEEQRARQVLQHVLLLAPRGYLADLARVGLRSLAPGPESRSVTANGGSPQTRVTSPQTYRDLARFYNPRLSEREADAIGDAILGYSAQYNIDPRLVVSVIVVESGFAPLARSHKGAMGLGQLMPATAASLGVHPYDPVQNIYGTVRVLRANLDRFGWENLPLALAAYNAGKGAVERYGGIPPYQETQLYVHSVAALYRRLLETYKAR